MVLLQLRDVTRRTCGRVKEWHMTIVVDHRRVVPRRIIIIWSPTRKNGKSTVCVVLTVASEPRKFGDARASIRAMGFAPHRVL